MMDKKILIAGAVFGLLGVIIGAFASHGLKPLISEAAMNTFETGVKYQMYHSLLLLLVGNMNFLSLKTRNICFWFLVIGIILFSGSIYLLATNDLTDFNFKRIGFITPIGGTALIIAWFILLWNFFKLKKK